VVSINPNYLKLKAGYLFPECPGEGNFRPPTPKPPDSLGIGDVTEPLPPPPRKR